jgi:hypothetical protein
MAIRRARTPLSGISKLSAVFLAVVLMSVGFTGAAGAAGSVVSAYNFEGIDRMTFDPYTDAEGGQLHLLPRSPYLPTVSQQTAVDGSQSMCVNVGVPGEHDKDSDRGEVQILGTGGSNVKVGNEYWYSLNVRPDPDLKPNPVDPSRGSRVTDLVFQIHNTTSPALDGPPMTLWTDSACYKAADFATVPHGARHQRITTYTPRHNGKVERYNRILAEELLYARVWTSEQQRTNALAVCNVHYNYHPPHTATGNQPPATRLHTGITNVMASYT